MVKTDSAGESFTDDRATFDDFTTVCSAIKSDGSLIGVVLGLSLRPDLVHASNPLAASGLSIALKSPRIAKSFCPGCLVTAGDAAGLAELL